MDTGFVSEAQEKYIRMNEPELYKAVLKKHGSFNKPKPKTDTSRLTTSENISVPRGRRRR